VRPYPQILKSSLLLDLQKVPNVMSKDYPDHGFKTLRYHASSWEKQAGKRSAA
jgi:hypothetical protein